MPKNVIYESFYFVWLEDTAFTQKAKKEQKRNKLLFLWEEKTLVVLQLTFESKMLNGLKSHGGLSHGGIKELKLLSQKPQPDFSLLLKYFEFLQNANIHYYIVECEIYWRVISSEVPKYVHDKSFFEN